MQRLHCAVERKLLLQQRRDLLLQIGQCLGLLPQTVRPANAQFVAALAAQMLHPRLRRRLLLQ